MIFENMNNNEIKIFNNNNMNNLLKSNEPIDIELINLINEINSLKQDYNDDYDIYF